MPSHHEQSVPVPGIQVSSALPHAIRTREWGLFDGELMGGSPLSAANNR